MCSEFGPDRLGFAGVIPERLIFSLFVITLGSSQVHYAWILTLVGFLCRVYIFGNLIV